MKKLVIIDSDLVFPPSEVSVFRDVTLYSTIYTDATVLIQSEQQHKDACYHYLKSLGAFDYVDEIILPGDEHGVIISKYPPYTIKARKLWAGNLNRLLNTIRGLL